MNQATQLSSHQSTAPCQLPPFPSCASYRVLKGLGLAAKALLLSPYKPICAQQVLPCDYPAFGFLEALSMGIL